MAKIKDLLSGADAKSRIFIVVATVIGIVGVIYIGSRILGGGPPPAGQARIAGAPAIQSVPGSQLTPEYYRALMQANTQAAQQAQISGTSAVPTLVNAPTQVPVQANCAIACPDAESADVTNDVNTLLREGKLSAAEASQLLAMAKNNVSVAEYTDALDDLVKQGKVTPEQARKLLETYKRQHTNATVAKSTPLIDSLVKSGQISLQTANDLVALQKRNLPPEEYEAELNRLVREGKIPPEGAAQLIAQYRLQQAQNKAAENEYELRKMAKAGQISPEVVDRLSALQKSGVTPAQYQAELNRLVEEGKMTPATAAQLIRQYAGGQVADPAQSLNNLVAATEQSNLATIDDAFGISPPEGESPSATSVLLSPDLQASVAQLADMNLSPEEYNRAIDQLVREGKISAADGEKIKAANMLSNLEKMNIPPEEYNRSVDQLVREGKISAAEAARLKGAYALSSLKKLNLSPEEYNKAVDQLVREGKISAADAEKAKRDYVLSDLNKLNLPPEEYNKAVDQLVREGKISAADAEKIKSAYALKALQKQNVSPAEYNNKVDQLVREGKLTPEAATRLKASYTRLQGVKEQARVLGNLQRSNASVAEYKAELARAVAKGLISPQEAARLLAEYQAAKAPLPPLPITGAVTTAPPSNLPGAQDFAILQQRLAADQLTLAARPREALVAGGGAETEDFSQFAAQQAAAAEEAERARQQRIQDLVTAMTGQAQSLVAAWQPPKMEHKAGSEGKQRQSSQAATGARSNARSADGKNSGEPETPPLIKAGTIAFATLTTAVNSDYPDTPVMATIVSGPLKGSILLGKLALAQGQDKVSLNFTLMNRDDWMKAKPVNAFAIDPDTARTVMASSVDRHYLLRYGTMFASSFVQGYAQGIQQSGATATTGIFGTSTVYPQLSPASKIAVGLGQVGTAFGNALQSYVNTPTTVKVNAGVGLGILFMSDVT